MPITVGVEDPQARNRTITDGMRAWPAWLRAYDPGAGDVAARWAWYTRVQELYAQLQPDDPVAAFILRTQAAQAARWNPLLRRGRG